MGDLARDVFLHVLPGDPRLTLSGDDLAVVCAGDNWNLKVFAAAHPNTPGEWLAAIADNPIVVPARERAEICLSVVGNPATPDDATVTMLERDTWRLAESAVANPRLATVSLAVIVGAFEREVREENWVGLFRVQSLPETVMRHANLTLPLAQRFALAMLDVMMAPDPDLGFDPQTVYEMRFAQRDYWNVIQSAAGIPALHGLINDEIRSRMLVYTASC